MCVHRDSCKPVLAPFTAGIKLLRSSCVFRKQEIVALLNTLMPQTRSHLYYQKSHFPLPCPSGKEICLEPQNIFVFYNEGNAAQKVLISLSRLLICPNQHTCIFSHDVATLYWATYTYSIRYLNFLFPVQRCHVLERL